ncbi:MAG: hypothetical protein NTX88_12305 [Candidatus Atribacteria bacterium]|nr:hypothetical protein [Candidatus Atribacteria bacterium]
MFEEVYLADLHIHSVLSPCAMRDMLPHCIILEAHEKKIDIIAITDHNACDNVHTAVKLGEQFGVWVIPGIEVETREEIHFLCYFPSVEALEDFHRHICYLLPFIPLDQAVWGEEWVINLEGGIQEKKPYLLTYPLSLSIENLVNTVTEWEGIVIPSHVDRKAYSILQVLGFIPPDLSFPVLEISRSCTVEQARTQFFLSDYRFLRSSDAHSLSEIGAAMTVFSMTSRSWSEFLLALHGAKGRSMHC